MNLQTFTFDDLPVRIVLREGEPWWIAADVLRVLDVDRTSLERLDPDEKGVETIHTPGGPQRMTLVSEPGLYLLVFGSRKPEAKTFKQWIAHEVLPSIRKTGAYSLESEAQRLARMSQAEVLQLAANIAMEKAALETKVQILQPKAAFHDAVAEAANTFSVAEVAKLFRTGEVRFFRWLRQQNYLMADNLPYQEYLDRGYFEVKEGTYKASGSGEPRAYRKTVITGKGQVWLQRQFMSAVS